MSSSQRGLAALTMIAVAANASAADLSSQLKAVRSVSREGQGNEAAAAAVRSLSTASANDLSQILAGFWSITARRKLSAKRRRICRRSTSRRKETSSDKTARSFRAGPIQRSEGSTPGIRSAVESRRDRRRPTDPKDAA